MNELLIRGHLGLGDHLATNAIVRHYAEKHVQVIVLCKPHNAASLNFMWRDNPAIETFSVENDDEADNATDFCRKKGFPILGLGFYGPQPFNSKEWDKEMYRQAGMEFKLRWNEFKVARQPSRELPKPDKPYIFVHDDASRGYAIDDSKLPKGLHVYRPTPGETPVIFDYWDILENAQEIHCIDSCFAILVDSLPHQRASRLVLHDYARNGLPPSYCKDWIRLK